MSGIFRKGGQRGVERNAPAVRARDAIIDQTAVKFAEQFRNARDRKAALLYAQYAADSGRSRRSVCRREITARAQRCKDDD